MAKMRRMLESLWMEVLDEFPNSSLAHLGYAEFLMECCCDFTEAARIKCKTDKIENHRWRAVDKCFLAFIRLFPQYIKYEILNYHGDMLRSRTSESHTSSRFSGKIDTFDADFAPEAYLDANTLNYAPLRLALEQPLSKVKNTSHQWLAGVVIGSFLFNVFLMIGLIIGLYATYDSAIARLACSRSISSCRVSTDSAVLLLLLHFANQTNRWHPLYDTAQCYLSRDDHLRQYRERALDAMAMGLKEFPVFTLELAALAAESDDPEYLTADITAPNVPLPICSGGVLHSYINLSIKSVFVNEFSLLAHFLLPDQNLSNSYKNDSNWCRLVNSVKSIAEAAYSSRTRVLDDYVTVFTGIGDQFNIALAVAPICFFIVSYLGFPIAGYVYSKELNQFFTLILRTDQGYKLEASKSLGPDAGAPITAIPIRHTACLSFLWAHLLVLLFLFLIAELLLVLALWFGMSTARNIVQLETWTYSVSTLLPRAYDALIHLFSVWFGRAFNSRSVDLQAEIATVEGYLTKIESTSITLSSPRGLGGDFLGSDAVVRSLVYGQDCPVGENVTELHDFYNCSLIVHLLIVFRGLVREALLLEPSSDGVIENLPLSHLEHLVMWHLSQQSQTVENRLAYLMEQKVSEFKRDLLVCCLCGVVIATIIFVVGLWFLGAMDSVFMCILVLMKRLPPHAMALNRELLDYLMWRNANHTRHGMTAAQTTMRLSSDGILSINSERAIEYLSPSVTQILGHSPEQLYGQTIDILFSTESAATFDSQLQQILSREGEKEVTFDLPCVTDKSTEVPCRIHLFPLNKDRGSDRIIVVISNIASHEERRLAAETARDEVKQLLYASLPYQIIARMDEGEIDIAFQVPVATVMFLSVGGISLLHASPQEILGSLATIYQAFDGRMEDFESITKIKIFADTYICASGLFSEHDAKETEELIDFGQNCLEILEDLNVKMYSQYTVQIGVNTGGPIVAGIVGVEGCMFDIVGDAVGLAAALLATAPLNTLQMADATHARIPAATYPMTRRNVVVNGDEVVTHLLKAVGSSSNAMV
jgi:guanylate cyclase